MRLPQVSMSFVWIILMCGFTSLVIIFGNLVFLGFHRHPTPPFKDIGSFNWKQGRQRLTQYGCGGCHIIPGVPGAVGRVGPSLENIHQQMFIAGSLTNDMERLSLWIQSPQKISPGSAMPDLGVTPEEAKDMAAYLYQVSQRRTETWYKRILSKLSLAQAF